MEPMGVGIFEILVLLVIVFLLLAALLVQASVRIIEGVRPGYGRSLGVVVLVSALGVAANFAIGMMFGATANELATGTGASATTGWGWMMTLPLSFLLSLLLHTAGIHWLLPLPDGQRIGWARAALAALLYLVLLLVLSILVGVGMGLGLQGIVPADA